MKSPSEKYLRKSDKVQKQKIWPQEWSREGPHSRIISRCIPGTYFKASEFLFRWTAECSWCFSRRHQRRYPHIHEEGGKADLEDKSQCVTSRSRQKSSGFSAIRPNWWLWRGWSPHLDITCCALNKGKDEFGKIFWFGLSEYTGLCFFAW